jgi:hypothetical protein
MAAVNFDELETAMMMVDDSAGCEAWVSRSTGKIHVRSDFVDPEEEDLPDDIDTSDDYVAIPDSHGLDLGQDLVFRFVKAEIPQEYDRVSEIFRKKGAYGRFSHLLDSLGKRDAWHQFRDEQTKAALRDWCEGHGLALQ